MTMCAKGHVFVKFEVSPEEKAAFQDACKRFGLSMSRTLREIVAVFPAELDKAQLPSSPRPT